MNSTNERNENRHAIVTGESKAHPIATGVGAAADEILCVASEVADLDMTGTLVSTELVEEGQYIDYTVIDKNDDKIGTVESVWLDSSNEPVYLAVRTGWLRMGEIVIVPAQNARVNRSAKHIEVPYLSEQTKNAPSFESSDQLSTSEEEKIITYYSNYGFNKDNWLQQRRHEQKIQDNKQSTNSSTTKRNQSQFP